MFIFNLNETKHSPLGYNYTCNGKEFSVHTLTNNTNEIMQPCYLIGQVDSLNANGWILQNKLLAGSFPKIGYILGTGFYITGDITDEYMRIAEPDVSSPGALKYIDGCSNTELISPVRIGMPTCNYLHVPAKTKQTSHIHKSDRFGLVACGHGYAFTGTTRHPLTKNDMFILPAYEDHYFETEDFSLSIIVFHPDSDIGPTDENNNMKIRTHI